MSWKKCEDADCDAFSPGLKIGNVVVLKPECGAGYNAADRRRCQMGEIQ